MAEFLAQLMPLEEVAKALGVSIYTVRRLVAASALSCVRIGNRVLVSSEVVAKAQKDGVVMPGSDRRGRPRKDEGRDGAR